MFPKNVPKKCSKHMFKKHVPTKCSKKCPNKMFQKNVQNKCSKKMFQKMFQKNVPKHVPKNVMKKCFENHNISNQSYDSACSKLFCFVTAKTQGEVKRTEHFDKTKCTDFHNIFYKHVMNFITCFTNNVMIFITFLIEMFCSLDVVAMRRQQP